MTHPDCIFCQIIAGKIPADKVYETNHHVAFRDIQPKAPVHLLVVPKTHSARLDEMAAGGNTPVVGELFGTAIKAGRGQRLKRLSAGGQRRTQGGAGGVSHARPRLSRLAGTR